MAKNKIKLPEKVDDVPATRGMLHLVRDDLRSEIRSVDYKWECHFKGLDLKFLNIDSRLDKVDQRFEQVDRRFDEVDARFEQIDRRFEEVDERFKQVDRRFIDLETKMDLRFDQARAENLSLFNQIMSQIHQTHALIEEQEARNRVVMDGLNVLFGRQERCEAKVAEVEKTLNEWILLK